MYFQDGIKNVKDAYFVIKMCNYETKLKIIIGVAFGLLFGALVAADPSLIPCVGGYAAPVSGCLLNDFLDGGQKEYKEAKKTLDSLLC